MKGDLVERAAGHLSSAFGSAKDQQRNFSTTEAACFSAATLLAARMRIKFSTAQKLVRSWYAAEETKKS